MNEFDSFIPLGETCNISFLTNNCKIKEATSLFEWFITTSLKSITKIIDKIISEQEIHIYEENDNIYIENESIKSSHYTLEEFRPIFKRRSDRFIEKIKQSQRLLFIRFEIRRDILYSVDDYNYFEQCIHKINPLCEIKLLLIRPDNNQVEHPIVIHKYVEYDRIHEDPFCAEPLLNTIFVNILNEVGYSIEIKNNKIFNDRDI